MKTNEYQITVLGPNDKVIVGRKDKYGVHPVRVCAETATAALQLVVSWLDISPAEKEDILNYGEGFTVTLKDAGEQHIDFIGLTGWIGEDFKPGWRHYIHSDEGHWVDETNGICRLVVPTQCGVDSDGWRFKVRPGLYKVVPGDAYSASRWYTIGE